MRVSVFSFSAILFSCFTSLAATEKISAWPDEFKLNDKQTVTIFQPQVEKMQDTSVQARAAFKITENKKETFGSFLMDSKALVSKDQGLVTLEKIKISDLQAPTAQIDKKEFTEKVEANLNAKLHPIPYKALLDNLNANDMADRKVPDLKNDPPSFVFTTKPSMLIMVAGDPKWVPVSDAKEVERIINTSALILHEKDKEYHLWALNTWFTAKQLMGPYQVSKKDLSSKYIIIKDELIKAKKVDPLEGKTTNGRPIYPPGVFPEVIIATKPTELLQSEGPPKYNPVAKTSLLYMSNSPNSIFLESTSQKYYILASGRWFSASSLSGPWSFASGKELPADFRKIPVNSPVAEVLVSVPGTPQAKEAVIATSIPQTAKVQRTLQPEKIECDGKQEWVSITGTNLKYASSCNTPIIELNKESYYAIQNGVWFVSTKSMGPWAVAIAVPDEIYKIPSSSPLFYITYVRIYSSTDTEVVVGYTPGYHGTFTSADGTVVYGTGYTYESYYSATTWYPAPSTYGFGVGYGWGYDSGFYMGFAMGSMMYPWGWGTCCWSSIYVNINVTNTYTNWGKRTVVSGPAGRGFTVSTVGNQKFAKTNYGSDIYTRHDGEVYRRQPGGQWQKYEGPNSWTDVNAQPKRNELDKMHQARTASADMDAGRADRPSMNTNTQRTPPPNVQPELRGGGGYRGGGGGGFRGGGGRR